MFGCCNRSMQEFKVSFDSPPDIERLRNLFGEIVRIEERDFSPSLPHKRWMMIRPDGKEEQVCTCPCHNDTGPAVMC